MAREMKDKARFIFDDEKGGAARPKIVCLCGSTRFFKEFLRANLEETMKGHIVLGIGNYRCSDKRLGVTKEQKTMLDLLHLRKIEMADEVLILNKGGYIGPSTKNEMHYAIRQGKIVKFLEDVHVKRDKEGQIQVIPVKAVRCRKKSK